MTHHKIDGTPLNILGLTQGLSFLLFLEVVKGIENQGQPLGHVGGLVSFYRSFKNLKKTTSRLQNMTLLKEWDVVSAARKDGADYGLLAKIEQELEPGALWDAVIGDRRLIYGRRSKVTQDYRVHFSDEEIWAILSQFVKRFERLLDHVQPDVILNFTPVTFGEILALKIASARKIPSLQLHSSRIRNFFGLHDKTAGTSQHFLDLLAHSHVLTPENLNIADDVLKEIGSRGAIYEGVNTNIRHGRPFTPLKALRTLPGAIKGEILRQLDPLAAADHHDPGFFHHWWITHLKQPLRAACVDRFIVQSGREVTVEELSNSQSYCFFPLHSEPEVALQVLGRPYHKNQIELLRNIAASLPAGMTLIVKEHPRSFGLRPVKYYEDLLQIPNLRFVNMRTATIDVVRHADLVAIISSTVGLEALILGKAVLAVGHPKYGGVFEDGIERCYNLFELPTAIKAALSKPPMSDEALRRGIATLVQGSVPIDLYSVLLQKQDRHAEGRESQSIEQRQKDDYRKLTHYTCQRIAQVLQSKTTGHKG